MNPNSSSDRIDGIARLERIGSGGGWFTKQMLVALRGFGSQPDHKAEIDIL
jgi:hypothetical protein